MSRAELERELKSLRLRWAVAVFSLGGPKAVAKKLWPYLPEGSNTGNADATEKYVDGLVERIRKWRSKSQPSIPDEWRDVLKAMKKAYPSEASELADVLENHEKIAKQLRIEPEEPPPPLPRSVEEDWIGFIIPQHSNSFFTDAMFLLDEKVQDWNARIVPGVSGGYATVEASLASHFIDRGVKALVWIPALSSYGHDFLDAITKVPVLLFDRRIPESMNRFSFVGFDPSKGTQEAVRELAKRGHKRIGYLMGTRRTPTAQERFEAFSKALVKVNLEVDEDLVFDGNYTPESGIACAEELVAMAEEDRPTAILAANDLMALGLMWRLQQEGWSLPRQLSIVGFDDITIAQFVSPTLTTIAQPLEDAMGECSAILENRVNGRSPHESHKPINLATRLKRRNSIDDCP